MLHSSERMGYIHGAPAKSGDRICTLRLLKATHDAPCVFFCVYMPAHLKNTVLFRPDSMVALVEQPKGWLVSFSTSSANSASVTTPIEICTSGGDSSEKLKEIIIMMAIPARTQFKFLFLCVKRADITARPRRLEATAADERSARLMFSRDFVLLFAGRLPVPAARGNLS